MKDDVVQQLKDLLEDGVNDLYSLEGFVGGFKVLATLYRDNGRKSRIVTSVVKHEDSGRVFRWEYESFLSAEVGDEYPWDFDHDWEPEEIFEESEEEE